MIKQFNVRWKVNKDKPVVLVAPKVVRAPDAVGGMHLATHSITILDTHLEKNKNNERNNNNDYYHRNDNYNTNDD